MTYFVRKKIMSKLSNFKINNTV